MANSRNVWCAAVALGFAVLLVPLLLVQAPPLLDFLNHLARIAVLADNGADPVLAAMYASRWRIVPNLALDILLTPLVRLMPILIAGRIAAGVALLLPVIGTLAYHRATYGRRSYWPLGACLVAYNAAFLMGFFNFLAGIGLAMLVAAAWIAWRDRHPARTVPLCALAMIALFFCHLMGVVLAVVLIGGFEADRIRLHAATAMRRALAATPLLAGPVLLYLMSPLRTVSGETLRLPAADKARQLLVPFISYDPWIDLSAVVVVGLCLLGLTLGGHCRVRGHAAIAAATLFALYLASPFIGKGVCFVDTRFAIMLGFMPFAAIMPVAVPRRVAGGIGVALACVFVLRMATIGSVWSGYQRDLDGMRAGMAEIRPGERVFVASVAPEEAPEYWRRAPRHRMLWTGLRLDYHLGALLLIERHAFWPFLFDDPSQQPIETLEPYRTLAENVGAIVPHRRLDIATTPALCGYQYVLLLNAAGEPDLAGYGAPRLSLLHANDVAALYSVRDPVDPARCAPVGPPPPR